MKWRSIRICFQKKNEKEKLIHKVFHTSYQVMHT